MRNNFIRLVFNSRFIRPHMAALALLSLAATGLAMAGSAVCHHGAGVAAYDHLVGNKSDMRLAHLAKRLDLTDAQQSAIEQVIRTQQQGALITHRQMALQLTELAQSDSVSDAYIAKAKAIGSLQGEAMGRGFIERAYLEAQIFSLLTSEQAQQYQQMRDDMTHKRAQHMQNIIKKANTRASPLK